MADRSQIDEILADGARRARRAPARAQPRQTAVGLEARSRHHGRSRRHADGIGYKRRNPWGVFLLSFVTLGVYSFVWWYKINNEMKNYGIAVHPTTCDAGRHARRASIIVPPFVSYYKTADRITQAQEKAGARSG